MRFAALLLALVLCSGAAPAPTMDEIAKDYVFLVLALGQHDAADERLVRQPRDEDVFRDAPAQRAQLGVVHRRIEAAVLVGGAAVGLTLIGVRNRRARHAAEFGGVILVLAVAVGIWIYVKW